MATRKRNEYLEASGSEDEGDDRGYSSEEDTRTGKVTTKRRKLSSDVSDEEDIVSDVEETSTTLPKSTSPDAPKDSASRPEKTRDLPGISKPLSKKNLVATEAAVKRSGVVYLSRVPPFMKPSKLRSLLEPYGAINRIFLTPEDPTSHTKRVRNGGNKKRSFTDGWVEFVRKGDAKKACELLNAGIIGGKKGTYYHDDVWNLLYLKGFKWNNLTEQIAAENAERASRMRAEISKTTKENKDFVQNIERAKMLETIQAKKAAKRLKEDGDTEPGGGKSQVVDAKQSNREERARSFKQTAVVAKKAPGSQTDQVKRVLSKIF